MKTPSNRLSSEPFPENRRSFLLLRWLVIVLASSVALFSNPGGEHFIAICFLVLGFSLTNAVLEFLPVRLVDTIRPRRWIAIADVAFLSGCLFVLAVEGFPIDAAPIVILVIVFMFYVLLTVSLDRDASRSARVLAEARNSEIQAEMTRTLMASMNPGEIHRVIVNGFAQALDGAECFVVQTVGSDVVFRVASDADTVPPPLPLEAVPLLEQANAQARTAVAGAESNGTGKGKRSECSLAVPMISGEHVYGFVYIRAVDLDAATSNATVDFLEVMAGAAANALRNAGMLDEMKHLARTDFLTGLPNHGYFQTALAREVGRANRHRHELSLLLIDLDCLKSVNDRFGHRAGDWAIRTIAGTIRDTCRETDIAARYGGEEFAVILPETDLAGAVQVAERIRRNIEKTHIGRAGRATASIGIANQPADAKMRDDLIRVADRALYAAKNGGRNRVVHSGRQPTPQ